MAFEALPRNVNAVNRVSFAGRQRLLRTRNGRRKHDFARATRETVIGSARCASGVASLGDVAVAQLESR